MGVAEWIQTAVGLAGIVVILGGIFAAAWYASNRRTADEVSDRALVATREFVETLTDELQFAREKLEAVTEENLRLTAENADLRAKTDLSELDAKIAARTGDAVVQVVTLIEESVNRIVASLDLHEIEAGKRSELMVGLIENVGHALAGNGGDFRKTRE